MKCAEATEPCEGCSPIQRGHLQEREPRAEPRQLSNDSISYTDGSKWHREISTHSLSMHYICSPYFCYCFVMVMHKYACKDIVKHLKLHSNFKFSFFFFGGGGYSAIHTDTHHSKGNIVWCHCRFRFLTHHQTIFCLFNLNTTNYCDFQGKRGWSCTSIQQLQEAMCKIKTEFVLPFVRDGAKSQEYSLRPLCPVEIVLLKALAVGISLEEI